MDISDAPALRESPTPQVDRPRRWSLLGYAPGGYLCKCLTCQEQFTGDKRAMSCLPCAATRANRIVGAAVEVQRAAGWQDIANAPRNGSHILVCKAGTSFGWLDGKQAPPVQTVVHWWGNPGEEGFYTSVNELEPQHPFEATHWKPLDEPGSELVGR